MVETHEVVPGNEGSGFGFLFHCTVNGDPGANTPTPKKKWVFKCNMFCGPLSETETHNGKGDNSAALSPSKERLFLQLFSFGAVKI